MPCNSESRRSKRNNTVYFALAALVLPLSSQCLYKLFQTVSSCFLFLLFVPLSVQFSTMRVSTIAFLYGTQFAAPLVAFPVSECSQDSCFWAVIVEFLQLWMWIRFIVKIIHFYRQSLPY